MPIFAQRYDLKCAACHTVLPELNAFGNAFRDHGYRLPAAVPRHGTTIAALRYNLVWQGNPPVGTRRFSPSASVLADADIGKINAYLHYNLGAAGGPSATFLGFLSYFNEHVGQLWRAGLFELPLKHSPEQRIDDLAPYGYEALTVGQNDLALGAPRLGVETERGFGPTHLAAELSFGSFKGAAYGGKPIDDGTTTVNGAPEFGLFVRRSLVAELSLNSEFIEGERRITLPGRASAGDPYQRYGVGFTALAFGSRLSLDVQQWFGRDGNADGNGDGISSSGGYARLKYFVSPHFYVATRYDAQAAPLSSRDVVFYLGTFVTPHARLVLQRENDLLRGTPTWSAEFIVAAPWQRTKK